MSRYETGLGDEFEPGSANRVLRNRLGITDPKVMDVAESVLLAKAFRRSLEQVETDTVFNAELIRSLHEDWLQSLYFFAGSLRRIDVSKDGFLFAKAEFLPQGLAELDELLARLTPCEGFDKARLAIAITHIHVEFEFLHPFREGNGRLGRWIADLMAAQAGRPPLQWNFDVAGSRERYFAAMRRGYLRDYGVLAALVEDALR